jgi:hypothetical protein
VLSGVHGCLQRVLRVTGADALFTISGPRERADTPAARSGSAGEPA